MEGKDVFTYSLTQSKKAKTLPTKTPAKLSSKGEALLFLTYYFKGRFLANGCYISFNDYKGHELWVYPPALFESTI